MLTPHTGRMLLVGMAAWTLLTAGIGWYALQGTTKASGHADNSGVSPTAAGAFGRSTASASATSRTTTRTVTSGTATRTTATPAATTTRRPSRTSVATPGTASKTPPATQTAQATAVIPSDETATASATSVAGEGQTTPTSSPTAVPTATPTTRVLPITPQATATPAPFPVPRYAQSAGVEAGAAGAGSGTAALIRDPAHAPNKGVVVLDAGHGRGDPGAVHHRPDGTPDVLEAEVNLRNAQLIRTALLALGYDVYLTRDGPGRGPDGPLVQQFIVSDLIWRTQLAAAVDADLFLALHGNGASVTSIAGPETWYCGLHARGSDNARFAALIQQAMMDALHEYGYFPPNRGIMEDAERHHGDFCQFVVTRDTVMPSALLEFLFLSNDDDARVLADVRSQEILAVHVAAAIDRFLTGSP